MTDLHEAAKAALEWFALAEKREERNRKEYGDTFGYSCMGVAYADGRLKEIRTIAANLRVALEAEQKSGHSPPKPNDAWDEEDRARTDEDWFFEAGHGED